MLPGGGAGGNPTGERERARGTRTPAPPLRTAKMPSRTGQASREDSGGCLRYPPCLGQLAPSGHACFFAGCRVHLCRFRGSGAPGARHSEGGRGLRVAASGSYDRIAVSTPVPGPEGAAAPWAAWSSLTETADGSAVAASRALRVSPGGDVAAACPGMSLTPTCQR